MKIDGFWRLINLKGSLGNFPVTVATSISESLFSCSASECQIPNPALVKPSSAVCLTVFILDSSSCRGRIASTATGHQILFRWKTRSWKRRVLSPKFPQI